MTQPLQARSLKTNESILNAAEALILRQGLNSLTMDAVAAEAEVSKGGLQHHFRSKQALIAGLVSRKLTAIRTSTTCEEQSIGDRRHRALLGMIRHSARQYGDEAGFPAALLVAATQNSECLGEIKSLLAETLARVRADSDRPDEAAVFVFASLGLLLSRALGFSTLTEEEAMSLFQTIERLAGHGGAATTTAD